MVHAVEQPVGLTEYEMRRDLTELSDQKLVDLVVESFHLSQGSIEFQESIFLYLVHLYPQVSITYDQTLRVLPLVVEETLRKFRTALDGEHTRGNGGHLVLPISSIEPVAAGFIDKLKETFDESKQLPEATQSTYRNLLRQLARDAVSVDLRFISNGRPQRVLPTPGQTELKSWHDKRYSYVIEHAFRGKKWGESSRRSYPEYDQLMREIYQILTTYLSVDLDQLPFERKIINELKKVISLYNQYHPETPFELPKGPENS
jgi:hypothetical protein